MDEDGGEERCPFLFNTQLHSMILVELVLFNICPIEGV
jgi:hypothetical protein